jgi:hypothetical protein
VNASARKLIEPDFCSTVSHVLTDPGMDPGALILEVTENIFIEADEQTAEVLGTLRATGIRLALDDFATGYSSLSYLRRLPIDIVKIDQCIFADINRKSTGRAANGAAVRRRRHPPSPRVRTDRDRRRSRDPKPAQRGPGRRLRAGPRLLLHLPDARYRNRRPTRESPRQVRAR